MAADNYIYVGPTIARLGLRRSMIVLGSTPPPQLQNLMETTPAIRSLFIPTSMCAEARQRVRTEGSLEFIAWQEVLKHRQTKEVKRPIEKVNVERKI